MVTPGGPGQPVSGRPCRLGPGGVAAVLDLPGVVQHVPGEAADRVSDRPGLGARVLGERQGGDDGVRDRPAVGGDGVAVAAMGRPQAKTELAGVGELGRDHVVDDGVAVPSAATRPLAQRGRRSGGDAVEDRPRRLEEAQEAGAGRLHQGCPLDGGDGARCAEVRGRRAGEALHHRQPIHGVGRPGFAGRRRHRGVPRGRLSEGEQRAGLVPARPAPARPRQAAGEHPARPRLDHDVDRPRPGARWRHGAEHDRRRLRRQGCRGAIRP